MQGYRKRANFDMYTAIIKMATKNKMLLFKEFDISEATEEQKAERGHKMTNFLFTLASNRAKRINKLSIYNF